MTVNFPPGWTRATHRKRAAFDADLTIYRAYQDVLNEVRRVGGSDVVIETDLRTRQDGAPIADQRQPLDPGAVVYFTLHGVKRALACDRWDKVQHNLRAIAYTLEAKRAVTRWGCATAEAEYKGYEALPPPGGTTSTSRPRRPAHEVLHVAPNAPREIVLAAFRARAKDLHPDAGGDQDAFTELVHARDELLAGRGVQ